jgi:acylphosphatase
MDGRNRPQKNITGWVRNRSDGTVEAVFSGEENAVHAMIEACKRGPAAARVDKITSYNWNEPVGDGFTALASL